MALLTLPVEVWSMSCASPSCATVPAVARTCKLLNSLVLNTYGAPWHDMSPRLTRRVLFKAHDRPTSCLGLPPVMAAALRISSANVLQSLCQRFRLMATVCLTQFGSLWATLQRQLDGYDQIVALLLAHGLKSTSGSLRSHSALPRCG